MSEDRPGHWLSLFKSFDTHFYRRIVNQSFGRSFVYVTLLSFAVSLLFSAKYSIMFMNFIPKSQYWVRAQLPEKWPQGLTEIKIEKGQVYSSVTQPFTQKWREVAFVLDTTGKINSLDEHNQGILITKNKVILKSKESKYETRTREFDLSKVDSLVIRRGDMDKGIIVEIVNNGKPYNITYKSFGVLLKLFSIAAFFALFFSGFVYYLIAKTLQALIFALFGLLTNTIINAGLRYSGLLNISIYAITPATALSIAIMLIGAKIPTFWLLYCLVFGVYLVMGIKNARDNLDIPAASSG